MKKTSKRSARLRELQEEAYRINADHFKTVILPRLQKQIGQCCKWQETACSSKESWTVYRKLIIVAPSDVSATLVFETCSMGLFGMANLGLDLGYASQNSDGMRAFMGRKQKKCSPAEYNKMRAAVLSEINDPVLQSARLMRKKAQ